MSAALSVPLQALLTEEISLSARLLELIGNEQTRLEQPLSADADEALQTKIGLLQELQGVSARRQDLMLQHGFDSSPQGVEFCSLACADNPGIRESFARLSELARQCHAANQLLGQLLNRKAGFFGRLLSNLSACGQEPLYQANGRREDFADLNLRRRLSV